MTYLILIIKVMKRYLKTNLNSEKKENKENKENLQKTRLKRHSVLDREIRIFVTFESNWIYLIPKSIELIEPTWNEWI